MIEPGMDRDLSRMKAAELLRWARSLPPESVADACLALTPDTRRAAQAALQVLRRRAEEETREMARLERMYAYEHEVWDLGIGPVAGVDEVGRGPLAGPVVAAAVILKPGSYIRRVNDSKQLPASERERLDGLIRAQALAVGLGAKAVEYIDKYNIAQAAFAAMRDALAMLAVRAEFVLVDGFRIPGLNLPQRAIVKGDCLSNSIAAASIVAKVARDRMMDDLHTLYPEYGFDHHRGYTTREHLLALRAHGPCPEHRKTFMAVSSSQIDLIAGAKPEVTDRG